MRHLRNFMNSNWFDVSRRCTVEMSKAAGCLGETEDPPITNLTVADERSVAYWGLMGEPVYCSDLGEERLIPLIGAWLSLKPHQSASSLLLVGARSTAHQPPFRSAFFSVGSG